MEKPPAKWVLVYRTKFCFRRTGCYLGSALTNKILFKRNREQIGSRFKELDPFLNSDFRLRFFELLPNLKKTLHMEITFPNRLPVHELKNSLRVPAIYSTYHIPLRFSFPTLFSIPTEYLFALFIKKSKGKRQNIISCRPFPVLKAHNFQCSRKPQ